MTDETPTVESALLSMLKEDNKVIAYRPRISRMVGTTSAILLQQMYFRYEGRPFYKLKSPCSSRLYKTGDSWCEELGFNSGEFDTALRHISTKCTKGKSKTELLDECPDIPQPESTETKKQYMKRLGKVLKYLIVFWTDHDHVTWYSLNTKLFAKLLIAIYIEKLDCAIHGLNGESQFIFIIDSKKTNKEKDSPPKNGGSGTGDDGIELGSDGRLTEKSWRLIEAHPPTPPTPHERLQALEAAKNEPPLTADQAEVLGMSYGRRCPAPVKWSGTELELERLGFMNPQSIKGTLEWHITDTGHAALEEHRKCCEPQQSKDCTVPEHINTACNDDACYCDLVDAMIVDDIGTAAFDCPTCDGTLEQKHWQITATGQSVCDSCYETNLQFAREKPVTPEEKVGALCEVDTDGMPHVDNCVVCQGDLFDVRTITYYTGYDNWPFPVCESCETWLQSLECEAPKPAPKKGRAKATCSKCGKKRKVVENDMCWQCNGYPDRAKMIDVIYAAWERKPQPTTMYSAANIKLMTTVAQWGTTLETLPDYVRWMINHYKSNDWTLKIGSFGKEDMWHEWQGSAAHELPMYDDPLYSDWIPEIYNEPTPKLTKAEGEALEAKVFKQMTELPTLPPEEGDDE